MVDNYQDTKHTSLAHGRAIGGARALHALGHISKQEMDKHIATSRKAIEAAKAAKQDTHPKTAKKKGK